LNKTQAVVEKPIRLRPHLKGRQVDREDRKALHRILGGPANQRDLLIEYLHKIQDSEACLPVGLLNALAADLNIAGAEVYEVASFYHHFDIVREGESRPARLTLRVCESLTCSLAGAEKLLLRLRQLLGEQLRVQAVPCVGRCEDAPIAVLGQNPIVQADEGAVLAALSSGATKASTPDAIDYHNYIIQGGYQLLKALDTGALSADTVIAALEVSGLRGLGGAGFPVYRKWNILRQQPAPRYMAVNIDEGEPGTFKDRYYLERDPHRFLEGMLIAAKITGMSAIWIYLRDEYAHCRQLLERELKALQAQAPCPLPVISLRRGAGAYICGEESAMIESIEGKRGVPRLRPPYVAERGLFGRPTLEHNMESLYWIREIVERGGEWFAAQGRRGRKGLRSFSVSGRVNKPGVHLAPAGITVVELINEYAGGMLEGHSFYAYLPGGASGGILPARMGDIPLDFDTLNPHGAFIGSAAVVVLSDKDKASDAARNLMHFFEHESCGQCTPCRVGTSKMNQLIARDQWDQRLIEELSQTMIDASICGLGQAAPNPVLLVMKHFAHEVS
jgi:NADH:ubiquinone oxidoreductase subunit F (NADH-binding)/NADH:ubiquinone oxidoreductase subunit E